MESAFQFRKETISSNTMDYPSTSRWYSNSAVRSMANFDNLYKNAIWKVTRVTLPPSSILTTFPEWKWLLRIRFNSSILLRYAYSIRDDIPSFRSNETKFKVLWCARLNEPRHGPSFARSNFSLTPFPHSVRKKRGGDDPIEG